MKNAALVVFSVLIGVVLLEAALRFFVVLPAPYPMPIRSLVMDARGFWIFDPGLKFVIDNGLEIRNKAVTIGADGLRRVPCRPAFADSSAPRIFIIGDSQTFGFGLTDDESWPNRLQCALRDNGQKAMVYNLGVPGINTDQYLMRLSQIEPILQPGDLILVVLTWNDLVTDQSWVRTDRIGVRPCPQSPASETLFACLERPKKYLNPVETWRLKFYRQTGLFVPGFSSIKEFADTAVMSSALAKVTVPRLKLLWYSLRGETALFDKLPKNSFADNIRIVARMRDLAQKKGARTEAMLLPNRIFADDYYYEFYSKGGTVFPERDYPRFATVSTCREHRLTCFSLFEALQTDDRDQYSFGYDGHLNPAGARAVAGALARRLR
jgi:lysophospholipase L1-like esterase